jgi:predicted nuclease of restriction endonuclease-like (RecB) superfamily
LAPQVGVVRDTTPWSSQSKVLLCYMRQFYLEYHDNEKLQPLVGEISWSKNLIIMARIIT